MSMHFPPATPLAIILFVALAFLVISTISTPVIKQIPLAVVSDVHFGVIGYCHDSGKCSKYNIGYDTSKYFNSESHSGAFSLPLDVRHRLSPLLVVHPIAAFLTLILFVLAAIAHFHSPSHSSRYLLAMVILMFPTLLVTLLAFLVDILVFVPNMRWGSWIVLGSVVLLAISLTFTCAMRRMLVSRRATQKRLDKHLVEGNPAVVAAAVAAASKPSTDGFKEPTAVHENHVNETPSFGANRDGATANAASGDRPYNLNAAATFGSYDTSHMPSAVNHQQHPAYAAEGMGYAMQPPEPWDDRQRDSYAMNTFNPNDIPGYGPAGYYPSPRAMSPTYYKEAQLPRRDSPMSAQGSGRESMGGYRGRPPSVPSTGGRGMPLPPGYGGLESNRGSPSNGRRGSRNTGEMNDHVPMRQPTLPNVGPPSPIRSQARPQRTNSGTINFSRPTSPREQQRFFGAPRQRFSTSPTPSPVPENQQMQQSAPPMPSSHPPIINVDSSDLSGHELVDSFHAINDPGYRGYFEDVEPMFAQGGQAKQELPRNLQPGTPNGELSDFFDIPNKFDTLDAHENDFDETDGIMPLLEQYDDEKGDHDHEQEQEQEMENADSNANASTIAMSQSNSTEQETATVIVRGSMRAESRNGTGSTAVSEPTSTDPENDNGDCNPELIATSAMFHGMNMGMVTPSLSSPEFPCVNPYPPYPAPSEMAPEHYQPAPGLMHARPVRSFAHSRFPTSPVEQDARRDNWDCLGPPIGLPHSITRENGLSQSYSYDSMPFNREHNRPNAGPGRGYMPLRQALRSPPHTKPQAPQHPPLSPLPPPSPVPYDCGALPSPSLDNLDRSRTIYSLSPSPSLSSHFTSVSQREINPRWRPEYDSRQLSNPAPYDYSNMAGVHSRAGATSPRDQLRWRLEQHQMQQAYRAKCTRDRLDVLLEGNPDFELVVGKEARQREAERGGLLSPRVPADKGVLCGISGKNR